MLEDFCSTLPLFLWIEFVSDVRLAYELVMMLKNKALIFGMTRDRPETVGWLWIVL